MYADLDGDALRAVARLWAEQVAAAERDDWYQRIKRDARHALFLTLTQVERFHIPRQALPRRLPWASAWIAGQPDAAVIRAFGSGDSDIRDRTER